MAITSLSECLLVEVTLSSETISHSHNAQGEEEIGARYFFARQLSMPFRFPWLRETDRVVLLVTVRK